MFKCLSDGCRQSGPFEWNTARRRPPITSSMSLLDRLFRARYYNAQRRCQTAIRIGPRWRSLILLSERRFAVGSCSTVNCHANYALKSGVEAIHPHHGFSTYHKFQSSPRFDDSYSLLYVTHDGTIKRRILVSYLKRNVLANKRGRHVAPMQCLHAGCAIPALHRPTTQLLFHAFHFSRCPRSCLHTILNVFFAVLCCSF